MRGEQAMPPLLVGVTVTAGAEQQWAVMPAGLRGVETPGELRPHSVFTGTAELMFVQVKASDVKQRKPFLYGHFADRHKHTVSVLT